MSLLGVDYLTAGCEYFSMRMLSRNSLSCGHDFQYFNFFCNVRILMRHSNSVDCVTLGLFLGTSSYKIYKCEIMIKYLFIHFRVYNKAG